jgi:o-succinylbenzoate---CoA ligase
MTRRLVGVSAADPITLAAALRSALADAGPAVKPIPVGSDTSFREGVGEVPDEVALVIETSGSTDAPKLVMLSAAALRSGAAATAAALGGHGQWLLALPAHYIAGVQVLLRSIIAGTTPIVLDGERFEPRSFATASARLDPTVLRFTSLVPVQLARLVDTAASDAAVAVALRSFDRILLGGQAAPAALVDRARALGARITRTYGSSETSGGCVYDGRPLDGVDVRIVEGAIELSGPMLAEGYLGDPARTAAAFTSDATGTRWYRTGDLGEMDDHGRLHVHGRSDDVIISGGVKVALGVVERIVREHPGFEEAVAIATVHPRWGEAVAIVAPRTAAADAVGAIDALGRTVASAAGPAARPARLLIVDQFPLLPSGKPDRRALTRLLDTSPGRSDR